MTDLLDLSATGMARAVRDREVSPLELVDAHIAQIEALDPVVNAVVVRRFDEAHEEARVAGESRGATGPLHGVPVTVKEAIAMAGLPWTNGSRLTADTRAERDAPAVRRLRAAGAILLGKTNISEFCAFYDSDNLVYGRTKNPHDPRLMPGGSSGGEAAAIASRMSPLGMGSDLGSSIRQPAAWCGVFGLKPSREAVPLQGHAWIGITPAFRLFGVIGPLARYAEDLVLANAVLTGRPPPPVPGAPARVAVYEDDGLQPVAQVCREAVRRAADALAHAGHELVEDRPPAPGDVRAAYDVMYPMELLPTLLTQVRGREGELSAPLRPMIEQLGAATPDFGLYLDTAAQLAELEARADEWLELNPIALCPVTPVTAPPSPEGITTVDGEPMNPGGKLTLCTYANALGLPAAAVPVMRDADGLPVAVHVMGRRGHDDEVLAVAHELEEALGGWIDPRESPASAVRPTPE